MSTTSSTVAAESTERTPLQPTAGETISHRALALLAQHRLVTSPQMHQMLAPDKTRQWTSKVLSTLRGDELITSTRLPGRTRLRAWFLTSRGVRVTAGWPELRGNTAQAPENAMDASLRAPHAPGVPYRRPGTGR